ncbi:MAG: NADH-quinone oxidoreductase subunit M [Anaerolineae bacterium]|jgi:NADH-quinone oxidoreductase subunit M|nr:NADH-quinone oxidoreductase subunit M [Anaerolineae bacterium]MBT7070118.1 NADH-quinone oxidoreductase subunit M [Anaerolineae bacterium]MBT7325802.1 NADH-quinone oxidoreductase subunit M [Anaerolineae bacterium]
MAFPILSVIIFTPLVAALILLMMPADRKTEIRMTALVSAAFALILSLWVYLSYDQAAAGYQFIEKYAWLPQFGISLHLGVDGISTPLVLLTGVVMFTGVIISWGIDDRPREFFAFLFILASGVFGVFVALDLFMLFFFYEIAVFPMYLLIAIWGWVKTREYAAMKLTLYLFIGSVVALVGALAMYFNSGLGTFDMLMLETANFSAKFQQIWFLPVFMGFAVLGGIFPFHNWSPDGHVAAPTAVSMFHAGVLMKLGAFAALRVGIMLLPLGAIYWQPLILGLAIVNVVYGAFIAMTQTDLKYMIGFSSVSHMGLVMLGFATLTQDGMIGASVQMFSHGAMTALFFAATGMVYDRAHTRQIPELGGMFKALPYVGVTFIIGGLVSMGMPGFSGFVAEFPIFMGVWRVAPWMAILAVISIVITAAYIMLAVRRTFFGEMPKEFEGHIGPISFMDKFALTLLSTLMIGLGMFPAVMVPMVKTGVEHIMEILKVVK